MWKPIGPIGIALAVLLAPSALGGQQPDREQSPEGRRSARADRGTSERPSSTLRTQRPEMSPNRRAGRAFQATAEQDDRSNRVRPRFDDRQRRSPRDRGADEPWFTPDWWYEQPDNGRRPPPRGDRPGDDDEQWFDPGWWHEWPDDPNRRDDQWRRPRDGFRGIPWGSPGYRYGDGRRGGDYRAPVRRPQAVLGTYLRDTRSGPRVDALVQGGPGVEAGLRRGDLLIAIDGRHVDSADAVRRLLRRYRPGQEVRLRYERNDRLRRTTAVLEPRREVY